MSEQSDYETFETHSIRHRRLLRQEELSLEISESIINIMQLENINKTELARRVGKSRSFVSRVLSGDRRLTVRSVADFADALGCRVLFELQSDKVTAKACAAAILQQREDERREP
jgi:transcriptional regulator with XRE-family HTH domain